jgi:putative polyketide hydroxylase
VSDVVAGRRHGLYVVTDPDVRGVLAPRGIGDRWGLSREHVPGLMPLVNADEADLVALIRRAAGVADLPVQIERTNSFRFAAQLARTYRNSRCFLVGDAAHRMTPRGGTGMNTAVQDAFDLSWKLAWVVWIRPGVSTLDLLGDGLTLLIAPPSDQQWPGPSPFKVPYEVHPLTAQPAAALGLAPGAAVLVRPDGREAARLALGEPVTAPGLHLV